MFLPKRIFFLPRRRAAGRRRRSGRRGAIIAAILIWCLLGDSLCAAAPEVPCCNHLSPPIALTRLSIDSWRSDTGDYTEIAGLLRSASWIRSEPSGIIDRAQTVERRCAELNAKRIDVLWAPLKKDVNDQWTVYTVPVSLFLSLVQKSRMNVALHIEGAPDASLAQSIREAAMQRHVILALDGSAAATEAQTILKVKRELPEVAVAMVIERLPRRTLLRKLLFSASWKAVDIVITRRRGPGQVLNQISFRIARAQGKQLWIDTRTPPERPRDGTDFPQDCSGEIGIDLPAVSPRAAGATEGIARNTLSGRIIGVFAAGMIGLGVGWLGGSAIFEWYPRIMQGLYRAISVFFPLMDAYLRLFAEWPGWLQAAGMGFCNTLIASLTVNFFTVTSELFSRTKLQKAKPSAVDWIKRMGQAIVHSFSWAFFIGAGVLGTGLYTFFALTERMIPETSGAAIAVKTVLQATVFGGFCYGAIFLYLSAAFTLPRDWFRTRAFWQTWRALLRDRFLVSWKIDLLWWYTIFAPMAFSFIPPVERVFAGGIWSWLFEPLRYFIVNRSGSSFNREIKERNQRALGHLQSLWWILPLFQDHRLWLCSKAVAGMFHGQERVALYKLIRPSLEQLFTNIYQQLPPAYQRNWPGAQMNAGVDLPSGNSTRIQQQLHYLHDLLALHPELHQPVKAEIKKMLWGTLLAIAAADTHPESIIDLAVSVPTSEQTGTSRLLIHSIRLRADGTAELIFTRTRKAISRGNGVLPDATPVRDAARKTTQELSTWMSRTLQQLSLPAVNRDVRRLLRQRSNGACTAYSRISFVLDIHNHWRDSEIESGMKRELEETARQLGTSYKKHVSIEWIDTDGIIAQRTDVPLSEVQDTTFSYPLRSASLRESRLMPEYIGSLTHLVFDLDDTLIHHPENVSSYGTFTALFVYAAVKLQPAPHPDQRSWYRIIAGLKTRLDEYPEMLEEEIMPVVLHSLGTGALLWFEQLRHAKSSDPMPERWAHRQAPDYLLHRDMLEGVFADLKIDPPLVRDYLQLFNQLYDRFIVQDNPFFPLLQYPPNVRLISLLRQAREVGLQLGIITNSTAAHVRDDFFRDALDNRIAPSEFCAIIASDTHPSEPFAQKPEPAIFTQFLETAGIGSGAEILMIGDSFLNDIQAPPADWQTVHTAGPHNTLDILEQLIAVRKNQHLLRRMQPLRRGIVSESNPLSSAI